MDLAHWWSSATKDERQKLADETGYEVSYLKKKASLNRTGNGLVPEKMAIKLCLASKGVTPGREMTFKELRPDVAEQYQSALGKGIAA